MYRRFIGFECAARRSCWASLERVNAHEEWAFVSIVQCGKFSHFQPAPIAAMSMATGTNQERSRMSFLLEDEGALRGDAF
jgi:hypothetical protein